MRAIVAAKGRLRRQFTVVIAATSRVQALTLEIPDPAFVRIDCIRENDGVGFTSLPEVTGASHERSQ